MTRPADLLSPDDARLLDHLTIGVSSADASATSSGTRRARVRGRGVEFHEHRHYEPGDDPRSIDWTVEARLGQLVVRVSRAEGDLRLHVLVDTSASMSVGTPSKLHCARRVAAALCYVAVERRDAAGVSTFDDGVRSSVAPASGRSQLFRSFEILRRSRAAGPSAVDRALMAYGSAVTGPGLVVVVSDFLVPGGGLQGLRYLLHRRLTPAVVQVLAPEEASPPFDDETELIDLEDPAARPIVIDATAIDQYRRRLDAHAGALRDFCRAQRLPWLQLQSDMPFAAIVRAIQRAGLMTSRA